MDGCFQHFHTHRSPNPPAGMDLLTNPHKAPVNLTTRATLLQTPAAPLSLPQDALLLSLEKVILGQ